MRGLSGARFHKFMSGTALIVAVAPAAVQGADSDAGQTSQLAEIVVTAQKRSQNLKDVPIAITAVSGDQLQASGVTNTEQLSTLVPGLTIRVSAGVFQPSIRGISTSSTSTENPVALYIDGVYYPIQREGLRDLNDIAQVAVLKGPQGTLFGRNATAGVIQITTKQPTHDDVVEGGVSYDNYQTIRGDTYLSGGLSESLAGSLSVDYATQGEGWGRNLTYGEDIFRLESLFSARSKFLLELGDQTDVTLIFDYINRRDSLGPNFRTYSGTLSAFPGLRPSTDPYDSYSGVISRNTFDGGGASVTLNHEFDFAKLVSISAFRQGKGQYRFDGTGVPGAFISLDAVNVPNKSFSQELQLVSVKNNDFVWTSGLYYFYAKQGNDPLNRYFSGPLAPLPTSARMTDTVADEKTNSVAAFAQGDLKILPKTTLTVGGRYTYEKRDFQGLVSASLKNGIFVPVASDPAGTATVEKPTWRVSLNQDLTSDITAYVAYNRGFKSGGFNIVSPSALSYQPEVLDDYEIGLKTELFDKRLRFNAAGFLYEYSNLQVLQYVNLIQTISNAAKAKLHGLDVDMEEALTSDLRLSGGFTWLYSEFTDYTNAIISSPKPTGGVNLASGDASGNQLPLAQKFSGSLSLDYDRKVNFGDLHFNISASHNSGYFFDADNFTRQRPYTMLNTSLGWTSLDKHYNLMLWGRNILDEHIASLVTASPFGYEATYGNPPLTFGVSAHVKW